METKRVRISFETVNKEDYTIITKESLAETNKRVKAVMKDAIRTYEKNESKSQQQAARFVLNA